MARLDNSSTVARVFVAAVTLSQIRYLDTDQCGRLSSVAP
jgi:hypothetical protein